jgi:hypothetical protein
MGQSHEGTEDSRMMMTEPVIDRAVIEALDFDPACERDICAAGNPAATHRLIVSISCHPRDMLICTACADVYFAFSSEVLSHCGWYRCRYCPEVWPIETTTVVAL